MPDLNFPTSPTLNDTYSFNGKTWVWNGEGWQLQNQGAINGLVIGNVTPADGTFTALSATGNVVGGNVTTTGLTKTATFSVTGNVIGNLIPSANITYDLGSSTQRWRDLWLSGTTIQLGAASISASGDSVSMGSGNISGNYFFGNGSQLTGIAIAVTTVAYPGTATAADPAGDQTITVTGTGFNSGIIAYINNTLCSTTYVSATSLTLVTPATAEGTYNISLYNTDGTNGTKPGGIIFSPLPVWVTASGALTGATVDVSYSTSVSATGDSIVYSVTTGSLPTGLSLNASTGAITGTPTVVATSTFSITATDAQNQGVARSFSIAVANVVSAVEYLVVAGGGGGGYNAAGGGGAGGFRTATGFSVTTGTPYTVTVGAGGATQPNNASGNPGSDSVFSSITSTGGGGGGGGVSGGVSGLSGGSGGGGQSGGNGANGGAGNTPSTSPSQGNNGGGTPAAGGNYPAGGGGGAGAVGGTPATNTSPGGNGGAGSTATANLGGDTYAGGGGGGTNSGTGGTGGSGGGGNGSNGAGTAGTVNTGGGGGGGGPASGGAGGSGIVIISYSDAFPAATSTTGSPTITVSGGYRVYKFTGSGSITF